MDGGNCIAPVEKYETTDKKEKNKKIYDKVLKFLGLTKDILDEDGSK